MALVTRTHPTILLYCETGIYRGIHYFSWEARWPSGRASDSGARGRGFNRHSGRHVVSLSKIHLLPKRVLVIPRKRWLRPDMTEKLLTEKWLTGT